MVKFISENWANILLIIVGSFALATYILQERKKKIDFSIDAEKEDDEQVYQLLHTDKETALKQYEDMMSSKEIKYWR